jgi:2-dehydro-3-deoxyglucarate aldolase/4-hydroxy-2-oxoheptanedioate aldolase
VARTGLDWVLVDLEHGSADESGLVTLMMAIEAGGSTPLVRVEAGARIRVGRALDRGAKGVMIPQLHSAEEARAAARWTRTQPAGERGIALFTRGMGYGASGHAGIAAIGEDVLTIVQIESRAALEDVEGIAAADGVDVLFVGPTDLTHALGIPGRLDEPLYDDAIRRVGRAVADAGKGAGVLVWNPEDVGRYVDTGFSFFAMSSETSTLDRATRAALASARRAASANTPIEVV